MNPRLRTLLALAVVLVAAAGPARAQLLSPGPLTSSHARLEGIRNCDNCHQLRQRGIDPAKCLSCHTPLRDRINRRTGLHARVARDCATCHRDHAGRDFDPVRFDTRTFDHSRTGFQLVGQHRRTGCRNCHQPGNITDTAVRRFVSPAGHLDDTFLGLPQACGTCHRTDSPHGGAFQGRDCDACHSPEGWEGAEATFNHAATGFALTGPHARVSCTNCHGEGGRFTGLSSSCRSCHADDSPHGAQFRGRECDACHAPAAWEGAPRFEHARTDFPLVGAHARVTCASCHPGSGARRQFEGVAHGTCATCHEDPHDGGFGGDCQTCHTPTGWGQMARTFDASRVDHEALTGFPLVGAHGSLECASCHGDPSRPRDGIAMQFVRTDGAFPAPAHETCQSCHADPHDGIFSNNPGGSECSGCHGQETFSVSAFDLTRHQVETRFPLTGAHVATPCTACHRSRDDGPPDFAPSTACETCHADDNPHGDTFAEANGTTTCGTCHATEGWDGALFDHSTTRFPLTGAHATVDCEGCHARETGPDGRAVRHFAGLDTACATCHADTSPHRDQFDGRACDTCHDTAAFTLATFDHTRTRFPLDGAHAAVACASCHRTERDDRGPFVRFRPLGTACADCHGSGR